MTSPSKNRSKQRHRARSQAHGAEPPRDLSPPQSVDEIIAARPTPPSQLSAYLKNGRACSSLISGRKFDAGRGPERTKLLSQIEASGKVQL